MVKLIIHAGMPKSGTTALQDFLHKNQDRLLDEGVCYPVSGRFSETANCHHKFFLSLAQGSHAWPFTPFSCITSCPDDLTDSIVNEISEKNADTVILSSEMLFELSRDIAVLERIRNNLAFADVKIFLVLRRQSAFVESMYAQRVRGAQRYSGSPKAHHADLLKAKLLQYTLPVHNISTVFGRGNLYLCWYEDVCDDVLKPLRILTGCILSGDQPMTYSNLRPTWAAIQASRYLNYLGWRHGLTRFRVLQTLHWIERLFGLMGLRWLLEGPFRPYTPARLRNIDRKYEATNRLVQGRYDFYWHRNNNYRGPSR